MHSQMKVRIRMLNHHKFLYYNNLHIQFFPYFPLNCLMLALIFFNFSSRKFPFPRQVIKFRYPKHHEKKYIATLKNCSNDITRFHGCNSMCGPPSLCVSGSE